LKGWSQNHITLTGPVTNVAVVAMLEE